MWLLLTYFGEERIATYKWRTKPLECVWHSIKLVNHLWRVIELVFIEHWLLICVNKKIGRSSVITLEVMIDTQVAPRYAQNHTLLFITRMNCLQIAIQAKQVM